MRLRSHALSMLGEREKKREGEQPVPLARTSALCSVLYGRGGLLARNSGVVRLVTKRIIEMTRKSALCRSPDGAAAVRLPQLRGEVTRGNFPVSAGPRKKRRRREEPEGARRSNWVCGGEVCSRDGIF